MNVQHLIEVFGPGILAAAAAWGAIKAELRSLNQRVRALEKHQQLQSTRLWSIAKGE